MPKTLTSELGLTSSTNSYMYLKLAVDEVIKHKKSGDTNSKTLKEIYTLVGKKCNAKPTCINMGLFRIISKDINKITIEYPNITRHIGVKEIIYRLADICIEKGCDF